MSGQKPSGDRLLLVNFSSIDGKSDRRNLPLGDRLGSGEFYA
ncbi:hypothetical protein [Microcoleus sp. AT3-D2]